MEAPTRYAGFWRRLAATIIDSMLVAVVLAPYLYFFTSGDYFYSHNFDSLPELLSELDWHYLLVNEGLPLLFFIYVWVHFEGSPGKRLYNCHVVDAVTFRPLTFKQALVRYLSYFVSLLPLGIGFLWIAFDRRKRGFHDLLAGSVVVIRDDAAEADDESQKSLQQLMKEASC